MLKYVIKEGAFAVKKKSSQELNEELGKQLGPGIYIVTPEAVEDITYDTKWLKALPKKFMAELIKAEHLFVYSPRSSNAKLIYPDAGDLTILNREGEIVDNNSKDLKDVVRIVTSKLNGDSRYDK